MAKVHTLVDIIRCLETVMQVEGTFVCDRWSNTGYSIQFVCYKALGTNLCHQNWKQIHLEQFSFIIETNRNRLSYTKGWWKGRYMICQPHLPPSSKCKNQIASFYWLPLKSGTLDPPLALVFLIAACSGLFLDTTFTPRHVWDAWPSVPLVYSAIWDRQ